ncbi:helix-turn-helix domain-containing protein [Actinomycetospora lemnae]|uniref:Helix-turn-helix domain-containing protein n=1 Tax=Actinomycetospora lemnae TaxID=3019891 RepID=A0ABT5SVN9_9PSEU|nr:helix-turn-helix domain-containing protein [Actinomycetospora sp. DW7H6]MDD7966211.1 helix-turn-helix domain-containing protein [Actinomycetospora sp. DW7H6]
MTSTGRRPHPALAGVVRRYAPYDEVATSSPLRRREAPHGAYTLILAWADPLELAGPGGRARHAAFLAGMHDGAVVTAFAGHQQGVQVDLTPLGVLRLLDRPTSALTNRVVPLDALAQPALAGLPERLAHTPPAECLAVVDSVLRGLLDRSRSRPDPEVAHAWARLAGARGRVAVSTLAGETGWSRRHLLTRFRDQIGLTPTTAGRVLRFREAARLLVPGPTGTRGPTAARIADVAAACGFADHSHLVREFRDLAGCTPSRYVLEWRAGFPDVQDAAAVDS